MNKTTKYIFIGLGVLALVGIGLFASAKGRRRMNESDNQPQMPSQSNMPESQAVPPQDNISVVASRVLDKIGGSPEVAQQRLANRKLRQSTRQAKLLKRGKIRIEDLQALQKV
jgi:FtsZ-interacting cell division protein ZipA